MGNRIPILIHSDHLRGLGVINDLHIWVAELLKLLEEQLGGRGQELVPIGVFAHHIVRIALAMPSNCIGSSPQKHML